MNPLDLRGPGFLAFYAVLSVCVLGWSWWRVRGRESGQSPRLSDLTADPYRIAFLRGGEVELVRVAIFNLVDRGLLDCKRGKLGVTRADAAALLRRPLDRAIISACAAGGSLRAVSRHAAVQGACAEYAADMRQRGLIVDAVEHRARMRIFGIALALLLGVAGAKLILALARGHTNVVLLLMFAFFTCFLEHRICGKQRTRLGDASLSGLRILVQRLRRRSMQLRAGGASNEALLLAAVFGLTALPAAAFPFLGQLLPGSASRGGNSGSCGSSCGSSSCGGGCGGGGCGGCGG